MTAQKYLEQYKDLAEVITNAEMRIEGLQAVAEKVVQELQQDRIQVSKEGRENENTILKIAEEKSMLSRLMMARHDIGLEIACNIRDFAPDNAKVLMDYYIMDETLEGIGVTYHKSRQWALRERRLGEDKLAQAMQEYPDSFTYVMERDFT